MTLGGGLSPRKLAEELLDVLNLERPALDRILLDQIFHGVERIIGLSLELTVRLASSLKPPDLSPSRGTCARGRSRPASSAVAVVGSAARRRIAGLAPQLGQHGREQVVGLPSAGSRGDRLELGDAPAVRPVDLRPRDRAVERHDGRAGQRHELRRSSRGFAASRSRSRSARDA